MLHGNGWSAREDADQSDADLRGREQLARIGGELERGTRAVAARTGHRLEPRPASGNDREFGHREKPVDRHQCDDDEYIPPRKWGERGQGSGVA